VAIERVRVKLPERFDERKPSHTEAVLAKLAEKHGPGWEVEAVDTEAGSLIATRQAANTQVAAQGDQMVLGLARGTKPSDGDRIAAKFEDANPGYTLTLFDPFVGRAVMTRLTEDEVRCRGAVATALGVKPWEVQVKRAADGAFNIQLPRTYTPSKHYDKLVEVAEAVVGAPGWYVRADAAKLTARIIPGERPMFAPAYAYPFRSKPDVFRIGIGQTLPAPGEQSRTLAVNLDGTVGLLVQGLAGSGKAELLTNRIPVPVSKSRPTGWATVGDLHNDDLVYSPDGRAVPLAGFSDVQVQDCFDVTFDDGQTIRVAAEHAWEVSSYSGRTRHYQRSRKNPVPVFAPLLDELQSLLGEIEPGTFGTIKDIAALTGVPEGRIRAVTASNDMACLTVTRAHEAGTFSTRNVRRYSVEEAAQHFRAEGFGQDLTGRGQDRWATPKELAFALGLGTTETAVRKVRDRLKDRAVTCRTSLERVEHTKSQLRRAQQVYPVTEVIARLVSFYEAARGRAPLTEVKTTRQMAEQLTARGGSHRNWAVAVPSGVDGDEQEVPVDPYLLGAWLGDGTSRAGEITVGEADEADMTALLSAAWDGEVTTVRDGSAARLRFGRPDRRRCKRGHDPSEWATGTDYGNYCAACRRVAPGDMVNASLGERLGDLGLRCNKHIPATYLRSSRDQRLALLQGLMDTDGTVDSKGCLELSLCSERLANDALELIRSLGIKASMKANDATITEDGERRVVGTRWRLHFTTTLPVFRLPRKAARIPTQTRETTQWLYVTDIKPAGRHKVRCLRVGTRESMYLTAGFVPTHNSVSINGFIYGALAAGHELAVIDVPHKKADFEWMKPYVRDHGWGCDSLEQALTVVTLVYEEGQRRGKLFDEHGAKKWQDLPASVRAQNPIITLVVDELSGLLTKDPIPKSLPKDHPMRVEAEMRAAAQDMLAVTLTKIPAEMRAAGIRLLYASQQAQSNTGIPPAIKLNIPNRVLLGANPSKQQRGHAFANPEKAPEVPEYIAEDEKASRGVGVAEFEGQAPVVFKSYFAPDSDFDRHLRDLGVRRTTRPEPTAAQVERVVPRLDDDDFADGDRPRSRLESEGGWGERDGRDAPGPVLKGAAAAAHALKVQSGR